jgi:5-methyltetrahydrofolate--homocysteine methyltransferase
MSNPKLTLIGERINPGFKSTKALFDNEDLPGIQALAKKQADAGASYLNVNIGPRALSDRDFMKAVIEAIQDAVDVPLSFDFPNIEVQEICLKTYNIEKAKGRKPIVNSISETRWDMLQLLKVRPFKVILMASERMEDGMGKPNKFSAEVAAVAKRMSKVLMGEHGLEPGDIFVDVSVSALSSDTEGLVKMAIDGIKAIGSDPEMKGVHISGGLSNIVQQLPPKLPDGQDLKELIERAFLTLTVPNGFDTVLGTPWKNYDLLAEDNPVLIAFKEIVELRGLDAMRRLRKLYRG